MTNLPHRFREQQFRKFEHVLAQAVAQFPQRLTINPTSMNMSPVTYSCRLRDAKRSLEENNWPTSVIDMKKFTAIKHLMRVGERNTGLVVVGDKDTIRDYNERRDLQEAIGVVAPAIQTDQVEFVDPPPVAVYTLVRLAEARKLVEPVRLRGVQESLLQTLREQHDITYEALPDGSFLLT